MKAKALTLAGVALAATIGLATTNPSVAVSDPIVPVTEPSYQVPIQSDTSYTHQDYLDDHGPTIITDSASTRCWEDGSCRYTAKGIIFPGYKKTKANSRKLARAILGPDGVMRCGTAACSTRDRVLDIKGKVVFRYQPAKRQVLFTVTTSYCRPSGSCAL